MKFIIIRYLVTITVLASASISASQTHKRKGDLHNTNAIISSLMEKIAKNFPESRAQQINLEQVFLQNEAVADSIQNQIDQRRSADPQESSSAAADADDDGGGTFSGTVTTNSYDEKRNARVKKGDTILSNQVYTGQPDPTGSLVQDAASLTISEGHHLHVTSMQYSGSDGTINSLTSGIAEMPNGHFYGDFTFSDETLGSASILVSPINSTQKQVAVTMGPYVFKKIFDLRTACTVYQWCTASGCNNLH